MVDVLIVGAGPAGSAAATHLAARGREVLLVDRCHFPRPKVCGEYYNPECTRLLEELGALPGIVAAGAVPVTGLSLGTAGGGSLDVPFTAAIGADAEGLTLGREKLDAILIETAVRAGATMLPGATCRRPIVSDGRVCGAVLERGGEEWEIHARITLAADGIRSRFARQLGIAKAPGRRRKLGLAARYRSADPEGETVLMHTSATGCCGLSARREEANLGMVVDASRARAIGGNRNGFFEAELAGYPDLRRFVTGGPTSVMTIGIFPWSTRHQCTAGCLLLGDAAGFYDPFTGQGVTFALLTAQLAAEIADDALRKDDLSSARLAEYEWRRRAMLMPRVLVQQAIQSVIERPWLLERTICRLGRRPGVARALVGVIADRLPAARTLSPGFLAGLVL